MTKVLRATSTTDDVLLRIDLHGKRVLVTGVSVESELRRRGLLRVGVSIPRAAVARGVRTYGS